MEGREGERTGGKEIDETIETGGKRESSSISCLTILEVGRVKRCCICLKR